MPKLIQLYIRQVLTGFAISAAFVGALMYLNVANLWHLVSHTSGGTIAVIMLWVFNGIVFSGVQFAIAIMGMAQKSDDDRGGRGKSIPTHLGAPIPVPVMAKQNSKVDRQLGNRR